MVPVPGRYLLVMPPSLRERRLPDLGAALTHRGLTSPRAPRPRRLQAPVFTYIAGWQPRCTGGVWDEHANDRKEAAMKVTKILVPLDGSTLAEAALPKALELVGENPGASLLLLRAAEAFALPGSDPTEAQIEVVREAENYLDSVAARLGEGGAGRVRTSVWYGPAAHAIVEAAHVTKADLIVMSTHGRSGLGRLMLGSVAESVLRGTRTPILLLRPDSAPVERPEGAAYSHRKDAAHV